MTRKEKNVQKAVKVALVAGAIITVVAAAILIAYFTVHNTGRIVTFGVAASDNQIDWGSLQPGDTAQVNLTITNTGSQAGNLTMTSDAPVYLTLTWNAENATLQGFESLPVTFTLQVAADAQPQNFNFDITITLTGGE